MVSTLIMYTMDPSNVNLHSRGFCTKSNGHKTYLSLNDSMKLHLLHLHQLNLYYLQYVRN